MKKTALTWVLIVVFYSATPNSKVVRIPSPQSYDWLDSFIQLYYPSSEVKAADFVKGIKHTDIKFAVSVAILENNLTCDPNAIKCRRNKTLFSEGEWDASTSKIQHKSYAESIAYFDSLIVTDYLTYDKDIEDLLQNFINKNGHRYAQYEGYERDLQWTYLRLENYEATFE